LLTIRKIVQAGIELFLQDNRISYTPSQKLGVHVSWHPNSVSHITIRLGFP
jgi:hypothetical protein